jgi:hypothetical protein
MIQIKTQRNDISRNRLCRAFQQCNPWEFFHESFSP